MILYGCWKSILFNQLTRFGENLVDIQEKDRSNAALKHPPSRAKNAPRCRTSRSKSGDMFAFASQHSHQIWIWRSVRASADRNTLRIPNANAVCSQQLLCYLQPATQVGSAWRNVSQARARNESLLFSSSGPSTKKVWFYQLNLRVVLGNRPTPFEWKWSGRIWETAKRRKQISRIRGRSIWRM